MSKLVELLNHDMIKTAAETDPSLIASEPYVRGRVDALNAALTVLPAHDAEIREQAMREQMEADLKAITAFDFEAGAGSQSMWPFVFEVVRAIRAAYTKAEQERKGGAA